HHPCRGEANLLGRLCHSGHGLISLNGILDAHEIHGPALRQQHAKRQRHDLLALLPVMRERRRRTGTGSPPAPLVGLIPPRPLLHRRTLPLQRPPWPRRAGQPAYERRTDRPRRIRRGTLVPTAVSLLGHALPVHWGHRHRPHALPPHALPPHALPPHALPPE